MRVAAPGTVASAVVPTNPLFVTVHSAFTSTNGTTWTARTQAAQNSWRDVTYGNGTLVAVSSDGTNRVMTSPDGITWTARSAAEANDWRGVTYGNGTFVAVANTGTNRVMTSTNGTTWTSRMAASQSGWSDVTYGNGTFVAVSPSGFMTSPDGITWTSRSNSSGGGSSHKVTFSGTNFVAAGDKPFGTSNGVQTSPDGATWTARSDGGDVFQVYKWRSVAAGGGMVAAAGIEKRIDGFNATSSSDNGVTWTLRTTPLGFDSQHGEWGDMTFGNGMFIAVSPSGNMRMMRSTNGTSWSGVTLSDTASAVTYAEI